MTHPMNPAPTCETCRYWLPNWTAERGAYDPSWLCVRFPVHAKAHPLEHFCGEHKPTGSEQ